MVAAVRRDLARNLAARRAWDWSRQDCELAEVHGLSRERIRQLRRALRATKARHYHRERTNGARRLVAWDAQLPAGVVPSTAEASRALGLKEKWTRELASMVGVRLVDGRGRK